MINNKKCPRKIRDKEQSDVNEFLVCHIEKVSSDGSKARGGNCDTRLEKAALMIIPTGVGASIGGYAGDASLYAQKIAKHIPLIVNPNIVNAAVFSGITENMFYVEGFAIEEFVKGNIALVPSKNNKIGIIFDRAISQSVLNIHINTINALKTVYGIDVTGYEITEESAGVEFFTTQSGASSGRVNNPQTLLKAGQKLLDNGANALAVVCSFEEPPEDDYENGDGVDIVGGVEAIISHYLTKKLMCPCVHAPAFEDVTITDKKVNPKVSAEYITPTFLPCLLFGLKNAPMLVDLNNTKPPANSITVKDLHSVSVPYNALGSSVVMDALAAGIPVYAVKENSTVLNIDKSILNLSEIKELQTYEDYVKVLDN